MSTKYYSSGQAADYLGYKESTLRHWRSKQTGPQYIATPTGAIRYTKESLDDWIGGDHD